MLGFAPGEPISMESFLTHVHPEDREPTRQALQRALDDESDYSAEYRVVLPDGRQRWIAANGRVQTPARDGAVRMLGVCMDVTARKQDEVEMAATAGRAGPCRSPVHAWPSWLRAWRTS